MVGLENGFESDDVNGEYSGWCSGISLLCQSERCNSALAYLGWNDFDERRGLLAAAAEEVSSSKTR